MASRIPFNVSMDANNPDLSKAVQFRLALFRRANPDVSWKPWNYGAAATREIDGKVGDRSWDALQSYLDFRFGKGVVTTYSNRPGLAHSLIWPQIRASLAKDTPYASDDQLAVPHYAQIQGARVQVPTLPAAKPGVISVACSLQSEPSMAGFGSVDGLSRNDQDSIFGHTYQGVPNPQIPFQHAYPTRYHGPIFTTPRFGMPFQPNPMAVAPFNGLGTSPDGLGNLTDPFSQAYGAAVAQAIQPVVVQTIRSTMPEIVAGVQSGIQGTLQTTMDSVKGSIQGAVDETLGSTKMQFAVGGGLVAAGLAALIIIRTRK